MTDQESTYALGFEPKLLWRSEDCGISLELIGGNALQICYYGKCSVKPIEDWSKLAWPKPDPNEPKESI